MLVGNLSKMPKSLPLNLAVTTPTPSFFKVEIRFYLVLFSFIKAK